MKILISPYSRALRNSALNPKNYPYWEAVVKGLIDARNEVIQLGVGKEEPIAGISSTYFNHTLKELKVMLDECDVWISVDNFFQHFCYLHNKPGIVIFTRSNPKIFGHPENVNILKDEKYLREKPFDIWEACEYDPEAYVDASVVIEAVNDWRNEHG